MRIFAQSLFCGAGFLVILFVLYTPTSVSAPEPDPAHPAFARPDLHFPDAERVAETLPRLYSLAVSWHGETIYEKYFRNKTPRALANLKSASKSVLAMLVGIAVDRGVVPDIDTKITEYFPELSNPNDPLKRDITIRNLLMMRSGLATTSNRTYGAWVSSSNWVRFALNRPLEAAPGERMIYSTGNTHLLSALLTRAAGESTRDFAQEALGDPLGFDVVAWPRDPQGIYFGGNDMLMTPRQMMMIGETYLNDGRYDDQQVVSAGWVRESCDGPVREGRRSQRYGYGWWGGEFDTFQVCYAWGYGGQYIFVLPELDLVVVTSSSPFDTPDRRGYNGLLFDMVENDIVVPIADATEWDRLYGDGNARTE